jgi:hypothetical protein
MQPTLLLPLIGALALSISACSSPTKKILVPGMGTLQIRKDATPEEIDRMVHDTYHAKLDWIPVH